MSDYATWTDLEALKRNLEFTKNELLKKQEQAANNDEKLKARDDIAAELERMSLLSEDIGKRMKAQELASTAQDLARNQERLMDALEKLQSGDKNLDAIMKQIAELAKTLASLQRGGLAAGAADAGRFYERRHYARSRLQRYVSRPRRDSQKAHGRRY